MCSQQLMSLMRFAEQEGKDDAEYCIAWLPEGKSFVIRNPDEFSRNLVPKFFKQTKFSSFTRKLYRWGFRQINRGIGPDDPIIFGNEFFDRDNEALMSKMRSITAAGTRKAEQRPNFNYLKRPHEGMYDMVGSDSKRMFFDQYMQHQKANLMHQNPSLYGGMSTNGMTPMGNFPMRQGAMGMEGHPMHPHQQQGPPMMMGHPGHPQQGMANSGASGQPMNKPYEAAMMHPNAQYQQHMHMQNSQMMGAHQMYAMQPGMQQQQQQQPQQQQQQMGMPQSHHPMQGMGHQGDQQGMHGSGMQQAMHGNGMQNMQGNVMQDNGGGAMNGSSHQPNNGAQTNNGGNVNANTGHNMTPNGQGSNQSGPGPAPGSGGSQTGGYPNPQSTAEIVNAAIAALRYSH